MSAKKLYCNKLLLNSNKKPKTTWNIVKTITNNKNTNSNVSTMNIKDKLSSNPLVIANAFNTYFSVAENSLIKNFSGKNTINNNDSMCYLHQNFRQYFSAIQLRNTTMYETEKRINSLKCKNSYGYDEISSRILKISTPYVLSPLTYIFNKILLTGTFRDRLNFSEVKPLYQKGDKTEVSNYRPISFLTSFSKITEKIIYKRLYCHLHNNNILVNEQFGFREKLSTKTATFTLLNNVLSSLDRKNFVGGLFYDLQQAFDCVNHDILLAKIEFYGISGIVIKLMKSYLEKRYQSISMKDSNFYCCTVHSEIKKLITHQQMQYLLNLEGLNFTLEFA
jgi:hypothetical protein